MGWETNLIFMSTAKLSKFVSHGKGKLTTVSRKVGPVSTLDMGNFRTLRGVSVADRKTHLNVLDKVKSFDQLRIHPVAKQHITANILKTPSMPPTPVQKVAIKALRKQNAASLGFNSWLIAAETGSGKTLAYLAPLLSKLLEQQEKQVDGDSAAAGPSIKSMVMVPTVELAEQVAKTISQCVPANTLNVDIFAGLQNSVSQLSKRVRRGVDVVVGTPDKTLKLAKEHPALMQRALENCHTLVIDEADSLMNQSFQPSTLQLIKQCTELQDLVFVTATIPRSFDKSLKSEFPNTRFLVTPSIHRLPRHIDFRVVEVWHRPYNNNKVLALQQALYSIYHDKTEDGRVKRVVVFVNMKRDVEPLVEALNSAGYTATGLNQDRSNLSEFLDAESAAVQDESSPRMKVLVATDVIARGIDFHKVRNIILYDMPPNAADLLHRSGRTGRLGTKGRVLLLVSKGENKGWIRGLETIVKQGVALA